MQPISAVIVVKNGERTIAEALQALASFDEVVLYDTGSCDRTLDIAQSFPNVTLYTQTFTGFGDCRNKAARLARNDWILAIDADEMISPELTKEILGLKLDPNTLYALPFHNYFNGKQIKWCGWHPESHIRLYNKKTTQFSDAKVHEGVIRQGLKEITLCHPVHHFPYSSISDFLVKMERYSTLFAEQNTGQKKSSPLIAFAHGAAAFFKSFLLKKGFMGGYEGFLISAYNGHTALYKYLKLYHANKDKSC